MDAGDVSPRVGNVVADDALVAFATILAMNRIAANLGQFWRALGCQYLVSENDLTRIAKSQSSARRRFARLLNTSAPFRNRARTQRLVHHRLSICWDATLMQ